MLQNPPRNQIATMDALWFWQDNFYYTPLGRSLVSTCDQVHHARGHRNLHKRELHELVRKFVAAYRQTIDARLSDADLKRFNELSLGPMERSDLLGGAGAKLKTLQEKWVVKRAAEQYGRDKRTIREALNPSVRSRAKR